MLATRVPRVPSLGSTTTDASWRTHVGVVLNKEDVMTSEPRWLDPLVQHLLRKAAKEGASAETRGLKTILCAVTRFDLETLAGKAPKVWNPYDLVVTSASRIDKLVREVDDDLDAGDKARAAKLPDQFASHLGCDYVTLSSKGVMYHLRQGAKLPTGATLSLIHI